MTPAGFEKLWRELAPQVLGALTRRYRDFSGAEDALQEALLAAATQWPGEGVPDNPRAWLIQVASRRLTDQIRSDVARRRRETESAMEAGYFIPPVEPAQGQDDDDTLVLMFLSCHPSLTLAASIALTLRVAGGLTTAEIARAFLVPEPTMAQRITRAKQTIKASAVPFRRPTPEEEPQRLRIVLHVLYLIFNEGYTASSGAQIHRTDLSAEAIRLARILHARLPGHTEVSGLLALMLLTDARRHARTASGGELIPLDLQDRSLWDRRQIEEGIEILSKALVEGSAGPYQVQAAIAAVHSEALRAEETDWPQILALYELLKKMSDNPMVSLNHAVAVAMAHGTQPGLDLLERLAADERLATHHRFHAVRAHLLEKAGRLVEAATEYRCAATKTASLAERHYLLARASQAEMVKG